MDQCCKGEIPRFKESEGIILPEQRSEPVEEGDLVDEVN